MAASPAGALASASEDGTVQLWEFDSTKCVWRSDLKEPACQLGFSLDGRLLGVSSGEATHVLDAATGKRLGLVPQSGTPRFSSDGKMMVLTGRKEAVVFELDRDREVARFSGQASAVKDA